MKYCLIPLLFLLLGCEDEINNSTMAHIPHKVTIIGHESHRAGTHVVYIIEGYPKIYSAYGKDTCVNDPVFVPGKQYNVPFYIETYNEPSKRKTIHTIDEACLLSVLIKNM